MTPEAEARLDAEIERQKYYAIHGEFPAAARNGHVAPAEIPAAERNGKHRAEHVEHYHADNVDEPEPLPDFGDEFSPPPDIERDDNRAEHFGQAHAEQVATTDDGIAERNGQDSETEVIRLPNETPDDPFRLARVYLQEQYNHADGCTLRYWREESHHWQGTAYVPVPAKELRALLARAVKDELDRLNCLALVAAAAKGEPPPTVPKVTTRMITDVANALASLTVTPSSIEPPAWLEREGPVPANEIMAAQNGLLHLPSFMRGVQCWYPHTPLYFSPNALDYDFDASAPEPKAWIAFLRQLWLDDLECIQMLQEWFGLMLVPDTKQQKILLLIGPKRSGKGTMARVLSGLVGLANVAGPTLASLGTNFGLWPLLGKSVAIISDARLSGRTDLAVVTERLLAISGEDAQTIDRKYLSSVTTKLNTRFTIISNEMPRLSDPSGALVSRMILLPLTRSWYGREDTHLSERLLAERPGILLWAIEGLRRLRERGHFVQPASGREMIGELEDLSSPIGAFIRDLCVVGVEREILVRDLFERLDGLEREQGTAGRRDGTVIRKGFAGRTSNPDSASTTLRRWPSQGIRGHRPADTRRRS